MDNTIMKFLLVKWEIILKWDGLLMIFKKLQKIEQKGEQEMMNIVLVWMEIEFYLGIMDVKNLDENGKKEM